MYVCNDNVNVQTKYYTCFRKGSKRVRVWLGRIVQKLDDTLMDVQTKYHTCFWKGLLKRACVTRYDCHHTYAPRCIHCCTQRRKGSSQCGCSFHVDVWRNDGDDHGTMTISIYWPHVPGSRPNVYYLLVHTHVVSCCKDDLFDVGDARHVTRMSMRKDDITSLWLVH